MSKILPIKEYITFSHFLVAFLWHEVAYRYQTGYFLLFISLFGDAWLTLRNLGATPPGARSAYQVEPAVAAAPPDFLTSCLSHGEDKAATDGHQLDLKPAFASFTCTAIITFCIVQVFYQAIKPSIHDWRTKPKQNSRYN